MHHTLRLVLLFLLCVPVAAIPYPLRDPFSSSSTPQHLVPKKLFDITLHYAQANQVLTLLTHAKHSLLSKNGLAFSDERTNQLWVYDLPQKIQLIQSFIAKLDVPVAQVMIKARLVTVDDHFLKEFGLILRKHYKNPLQENNTEDLKQPETSVLDVPLLTLKKSHFLNVTLTAMEQAGHVEIISSPELMTNNRQTAKIESGEVIPYPEQGKDGNTSSAFKKATLQLQVTPIVLPGDKIMLTLQVNQDKISELIINGVPAIRTQALTTSVMVHNQDTVVLGGIYEHSQQQESRFTPPLSRLPVLGQLFKHHQKSLTHKQLFIFVTPRIVRGN